MTNKHTKLRERETFIDLRLTQISFSYIIYFSLPNYSPQLGIPLSGVAESQELFDCKLHGVNAPPALWYPSTCHWCSCWMFYSDLLLPPSCWSTVWKQGTAVKGERTWRCNLSSFWKQRIDSLTLFFGTIDGKHACEHILNAGTPFLLLLRPLCASEASLLRLHAFKMPLKWVNQQLASLLSLDQLISSP